MSARLGPFLLEEPLGAGAMGVVYRARHEAQATPVAVKVDAATADPRSNAAFLHEVQITAALDHPNVVMILDHGVVDPHASRTSRGKLVEGARWLAMELAPGGTAAEHVPGNWAEVMHLMRGLLAGLAHAHARGVVHRDIKLQNILLAGDEASVATSPGSLLASRIVVSDFGVSDRLDTSLTRSGSPIGTPEFMAPEQIEGRWRDQGPWTDLYAVGVLLYLLTVRDFPFSGSDRHEVYRRHLDDRVPRFKPVMPVPEGLDEIVYSLLSKEPVGRPEFAAQVQRALDALGPPRTSLAGDETTDFDTSMQPTVAVPDLPVRSSRSYASRGAGTLAEVPLLHGGRRRNARMESAGLALFGLRTVPLVGRETECDRLWHELVAVRTRKRASVVFLRGPAGIGKSRLAQWVAQRTHELGVATTLRTVHEPGSPPGAGVAQLLRNELRTEGLTAPELESRLLARFGSVPFDLNALAAALEPSLYERPPTSPAELRQLTIAVLSHMSGSRPLIVVLDDVQHDLAALELVDSLLLAQEFLPRPMLVLATLRDEDLVDVPEVEELLGELLEDPNASAIDVGPLDDEGRRKLVRSLLDLDGGLAARIERRTEGNPMFAQQLLGAWVEQGVLLPGPKGFRLAPGRRGDLPSDLEEVWRNRLADATRSFTDAHVESLEIAAAWGTEVVDRYWRGACDVLEVEPAEALLDELRKRHLVHLEDPRAARWRFAHGALREILVQRAREADRWRRHNLGIAIWLRESEVPVPAATRARHFLESEVFEEAIEPLVEAINDQIDVGDLRNPLLVDQLQQVLDSLGLTGSSSEWAELEVLRAIRHRGRGQLDMALELAQRAAALAESEGWQEVEAKALRECARVHLAKGSYEPALENARRARSAFLVRGDKVRAADCETVEASILFAKARYDEAEAAYAHAIEVFDRAAPARITSPMLGMVRINVARGDEERTAAWLSELRARARPLGLQLALAHCANVEGELARAAGDEATAALLYRQASERLQMLESAEFAVPLLNLGILDVSAGRFEAAGQRIQSLLVYLRRHPHDLFNMYAHMITMASAAGRGDRVTATYALGVVKRFVDSTGLLDPDLARMAEVTGLEMRKQGWAESREALDLAILQHRATGHGSDAERLERLV